MTNSCAPAADKGDISYSDFVTRLVRAQWQAKQEGALEWRIRRANLPERWTLETFPFTRQPGVNRKQIRGFPELEFIAKAENIVRASHATPVGAHPMRASAPMMENKPHASGADDIAAPHDSTYEHACGLRDAGDEAYGVFCSRGLSIITGWPGTPGDRRKP